MKQLIVLKLGIIIFLGGLLLTGCNNSVSGPSKGGLVGKVAPDFTLSDMHGQQVSLSQFRGKVVVVNFWATWCPPCRQEKPTMERLYRILRDKGLVILAVNVEENGKQAVGEYQNENPHSFPILLDHESVAQHAYGVFRFPESFIIDRNGVVVEKVIGARDWMHDLSFKSIVSLLEE